MQAASLQAGQRLKRSHAVADDHGDPAELLVAEAENAGAERVMIVAHNPGLHELAARWSHRNNELETKVRAKFPTCAGAVFARKDKDSSWKLQAYVTPKLISD